MPAGYHYGAKLRIAPTGLSPASTAASLAAPCRGQSRAPGAAVRPDGRKPSVHAEAVELFNRGTRRVDANDSLGGYASRKMLSIANRDQALRRIRFAWVHQRLDPVGDALRGLAQLPDRPVGGIPFGDVACARVVDQPLGQRARQH